MAVFKAQAIRNIIRLMHKAQVDDRINIISCFLQSLVQGTGWVTGLGMVPSGDVRNTTRISTAMLVRTTVSLYETGNTAHILRPTPSTAVNTVLTHFPAQGLLPGFSPLLEARCVGHARCL